MKLVLPLLLAVATAVPVRAESVVYVLDPDHSFAYFEVLHFGTSTLRGRFGALSGQVELDLAAHHGRAEVRIPTAGVDTGMPTFDARLRRSDLLASEDYPEARFVASSFHFDGAQLRALTGELTLRGTSQALELRALRFGCHSHPDLQREVCGGDFEGELERADFGAGFGMPFVDNRVRLVIQVEGIRQ